MARERLAIIGGDAAGMSAASIARRRDGELDIVAFERGGYTSYSACGIPYLVGGVVEDANRLISRRPEEHRERGIDVRTGTEVLAIDLAARVLTVRSDEDGESREPFDQLVVATGAEPVLPDIPGAEAIEPARTVDAGERLAAELQRGRGSCAVVIGAGYIGLEMAEAFAKRGLNVTMLDLAPQVMGTLDADMAAHVQAAAERQGIRVVLGVKIEEIVTDDGAPVEVRAGGETYPADHVAIGTGARPAVKLAEAAGIELGDSGALRVDDHQRCPGHDGVFAAGDCAESHHRVLDRPVNIQLGTHANKQGRIAGVNATGGSASFPGVLGTAVSKICSCEVARTGISEREADKAGIEVVSATIKDRTRAGYYPGAGQIWVKLVAEPGSGRLLGGQIVGVEGAAKRIDVLATAIWTCLAVDELALLDLSYAPPFSGVYDPLLIAARAVAKLV